MLQKKAEDKRAGIPYNYLVGFARIDLSSEGPLWGIDDAPHAILPFPSPRIPQESF